MPLQHYSPMICLVKSLFRIKTMNNLESVNARLVVHLLFIMYNDIWIHHSTLSSLENLRYLNRYLQI